jgi:ElaB/YqjD/DUF883 family membrane-anchored ribosome-binding protein
MKHTSTSSEQIAEALKLLEDAATQKKDELMGVLSDKYTHLRDLILETESSLSKSLSDTKRHAFDEADQAKDAGVKKVRELARDVDKKVRRNPWPYIGGTAVAGLLLGCFYGSNRK